MVKIWTGGATAVVLAAVSCAHAQDAVQWRVEDGGNGHWYAAYIHPVSVSHVELRAQAVMVGGYAGSLTNEQEAQFVTQHVITGRSGPYPDTFLLGAIRVAGDWAWSSGEPWGYTNWGGQGCPSGPYPNNGGGGQQIRMPTCPDSWETETEYHWDDFVNESGRCLLIEWSADCNNDGIVDYGQILDGTYSDKNGNGTPDCCDAGTPCDPSRAEAEQWRVEDGGNGHWYQRVPWSGDDLIAFNDNLIDQGAHLASVGSSSEQNFVSSLSTDLEYWTMLGGVRDISIPCGQISGWSWLDGTTFDFTSWDVGTCPQPDCSVSTAIAFGWDRNGCEPTTRWHDVRPEDVYIRFAIAEWSADCNGDGIIDYGQILDGTYADENGNGVPDCCDEGVDCDCPADLNEDGSVGPPDLGILLALWSTDGSPNGADINGDKTVNAADLGLLIGAWGDCG